MNHNNFGLRILRQAQDRFSDCGFAHNVTEQLADGVDVAQACPEHPERQSKSLP
jgi:hypothetical protein